MIRDIITNKWFIGPIALLIIFAGACYLWYQHDTAPDRKAAADALKLLRQHEATQKAEAESKTGQAADTPVEGSTPTTEKSITNEVTAEVENNTEGETQQPSDMPAANAEAKDVPMSPFGFGPYPEVPPGFAETLGLPIWTQDPEKYSGYSIASRRNFELMHRVLIKLWSEGDHDVMGATAENGKIYPIYRNVLYLTEKIETGPDGIIRGRRSGLSGQPVQLIPKKIIPEGMQIIDRETGGIDPYQFLNLNR